MLRLTRVFPAMPLFLTAGLLLHLESVDSADNPVVQLTIAGAIGPVADGPG